MGKAAKSEIRIEFKSEAIIPLGITSETALEQSLRGFYKRSHSLYDGQEKYIDITITDFELYDGEVELTLYSTRGRNLEFQLELLQEFLEVDHDDVVEEVNYNTWHQA